MDAASREKMYNIAKDIKGMTSVLDVMTTQPLTKLRYTIAEASSYSGIYEP
jgi:hypothetical protein